jgi:hypothetical protein
MQFSKHLRLFFAALGLVAAIGIVVYGSGTVFASHSFEAGVSANNLPDNTHVRLDGLSLAAGGVLPVYDASPNFIAGHLLLRSPCNPDTHVPTVTVIAGHIDESANATFVDKVPLYYISHASGPDSCVYHAHIPDPLNGGATRVTDIALVNYSNETIEFNGGDMVDLNVQRVLGSISDAPYNTTQLPGNLTSGNPVFDLNDNSMENDGLGVMHHD